MVWCCSYFLWCSSYWLRRDAILTNAEQCSLTWCRRYLKWERDSQTDICRRFPTHQYWVTSHSSINGSKYRIKIRTRLKERKEHWTTRQCSKPSTKPLISDIKRCNRWFVKQVLHCQCHQHKQRDSLHTMHVLNICMQILPQHIS